jgi:hypothetical protein
MAKLDTQTTDEFGTTQRAIAEKASKSNGTGGYSGRAASIHVEGDGREQSLPVFVHGSGNKNNMDNGVNGGHSLNDWGAAAKRSGNGYSGGDNLLYHAHSLRAMKALAMVDNVLWWGLWGFRLALATTVLAVICGMFLKYDLLKSLF